MLKLVEATHPALKEVCHPVQFGETNDPATFTYDKATLAEMVDRMVEIMENKRGMGIAAPQVGLPLRIIAYIIPSQKGGQKAITAGVIFNPTYKVIGNGGYKTDVEGCLTFLGKFKRVRRARKIRVTGQVLDGTEVTFDAEGLLARVIQHEVDHLNGKMIFPVEG